MKNTELVCEETKGITPFAYKMIDEWLYFCDLNIPGLFRYHFKSGVCECVAQFDNRYINMNFFKMFAYEGELWMLPFWDGNIVCFNIEKQEIYYYQIPENVEEKSIPFIDMYFCGKEAYILPNGNNKFMIKVDLITHRMDEIELSSIRGKSGTVSFVGAVKIEDRIYLAEGSKNLLFLFDINDNGMSVIDAKGNILKDSTVRTIGNKIYFFPWDVEQKVVIYDVNTKKFYQEEYPIKNLSHGEECVVVIYDNDIWILANKKKKIYSLNHDMKIESIVSILNLTKSEKIAYVSGVIENDRFFFHGHDGVPLIQIKDGCAQVVEVSKNKNILESYIEMINKKFDVCHKRINRLEIGKLIYKKIDTNR